MSPIPLVPAVPWGRLYSHLAKLGRTGAKASRERRSRSDRSGSWSLRLLPVAWLNTIWLNFFVESFGLKILSQVTTKLSQLHSNSRNKHVNSRNYHNVGQMRCMQTEAVITGKTTIIELKQR